MRIFVAFALSNVWSAFASDLILQFLWTQCLPSDVKHRFAVALRIGHASLPPDKETIMQRRPGRALSVEAEIASLHDGLRRNHEKFYDLGFKVNAALAVALGWFVVEENPLPQLCSEFHYPLEASVTVLILCWVAVSVVFCSQYRSSKASVVALQALGVPAPMYAPDLISKLILALGIVFQLIIFTCLGMSIWMVYLRAPDSSPCQLMKTERDARMAEAKAKLNGNTKNDCIPNVR